MTAFPVEAAAGVGVETIFPENSIAGLLGRGRRAVAR